MKIAVIAGICVERDAISGAAAGQAAMLAALPDVEEVTLIAHVHGRSCAVPTLVAENSWELIQALDRLDVDLAIFHWGIRYDLFNALPLVAANRRAVVHFHNLTPLAVAAPDQRVVIEQSIRQMQLPVVADVPLWAVSQHNADTLVEWGYDRNRITIVPILAVRDLPIRTPRRPTDPVRLLTVGRVVAAKGVDVLVEAMRLVTARLDHEVRLVIAGGAAFSDRAFLAELREEIHSGGLDDVVCIALDLDDDELGAAYADADVLVSPSLHEGLCVPVIEAYHAGLRVVGSNAGNLPYVVQPPDPIVPVSDAAALSDAIVAVAREIVAGTSTVPSGAADLVARHAHEGVQTALRSAVAAVTGDCAGISRA